MEERLGRFGRPLTTVLVLSLGLGGAAWGLKLFWDNVVFPIYHVVLDIINVQEITLEELIKRVGLPIVVYFLFIVLLWIVSKIVFNRTIIKPSIIANESAMAILIKAEENVERAEELLLILKSVNDTKDSQSEGVSPTYPETTKDSHDC
ncbi:hypothetical protein ACFLWB_00275 [Chloroflexota bacterium]